MKDLIIDFHIHLATYETMRPWVLEWYNSSPNQYSEKELASYSNPEKFVHMLKNSGVDYGVVLAEYSPITTGICSNDSVAAFCAEHKELIPFANVNPFRQPDSGKEVKRLVEQSGFRGLKLYPTYQQFYPNAREVYPIYAAAEELGIPVMLHTGSSIFKGSRMKFGDPLYLDDVAVDFPDLKILLVHSGRGFWYDRAFFLAKLHENVFMEISGLPPQKLLTYFPEFERNADKIIFGSDWPGMPDIQGNIEAIRNLPISEESKTKILGGNAAKLLNLV